MGNLPEKNPGYVYAASNGQAVKFGVSGRPTRRVGGLRTGSPTKIRVLKSWRTADSYRHEQAIFELLKPRRLFGEWFKIDDRGAVCLGDCYFSFGPDDKRTKALLACLLAENIAVEAYCWTQLHRIDPDLAERFDPYDAGVERAAQIYQRRLNV